MGLSFSDFELSLGHCGDFFNQKSLAVAVSGGPDSMAMTWLLSQYGLAHGKTIYAYTVDHDLRRESADEAKLVGQWVAGFKNTVHKIVKWDGEKPSTRILEEARTARYNLLAKAANKDGCAFLFVAHHRDDQAETFLMRLAKGSGVDGLAGMRYTQAFLTPTGQMITICRPLLDFSKEDLVQVCHDNRIAFVQDPTNENEIFLRPRLRAIQEVLEEEGLTPKRLASTAKRLLRARTALETLSQDLFDKSLKQNSEAEFIFDYNSLKDAPEELSLRVMLFCVGQIYPDEDYGPRLERMENLNIRIFKDKNFKSATLAGCLFSVDRKLGILSIKKEL